MSAVEIVKRQLDNFLRVTLSDGRVLIGRFACFDKQRNVLLVEARETRAGAPDGRNLGIVLVPRRWITECHAMDTS